MQKARVSWLKDGDRNTKDFHATLTERRARKTIRRIKATVGLCLLGKPTSKDRLHSTFFIFIEVGTASRVEGLFQPCWEIVKEDLVKAIKN